ncbi:hypothetical protein M430DRAFT_24027 [Amorphotheca resinae ATCC 22711]|jgi:hypothetical protein|uniref:Vacuolar protein sorting-associated protein 62 n=1 Tax=Amorphotheca resinae ATCC 22711 TaxID=857342 RepID=A0A2T3BDW1_AMORE|nr:hypothetical protein M430DRAFT_24027 [Amorphotheca resinae ATCC 22711]PSS27591.1 hypothetical protein M430DRAFT_24027 [Amorphotheca resinae ATCC 22711]
MFVSRIFAVVLFVAISWFALASLRRHLDPNTHPSEEDRENLAWIASSPYLLDRLACRTFGLCGLAHYRPDPAWQQRRRRHHRHQELLADIEADTKHAGWEEAPVGEKLRPEHFDGDKRVLKDVPQYVLDHAPLIHLYSGEQFWPSDFAEHLTHTTPYLNHTAINTSAYDLYNLDQLNDAAPRGRNIFLRSVDDIEDRPDWLGSAYNKPIPYEDEDEEESEEVETHTDFVDTTDDADKEVWFDPFGPKSASPLPPTFRAQPQPKHHRSLIKRSNGNPANKPDQSGRSPAPAVLILVDKGNGILDAFWFYFYSYNLGTTVLNIRFGNHVGDWEHSLIRFHHGVPKAVFFSAHSGGTAYSYKAVEKGKGKGREGRPVLYSALGSHAMYAMPGLQPYVLPFGLLADVTDKGPLWDPALNFLAYHFNTTITHNADAKSMPPEPPSPESPHTSKVHRRTDMLQPASCNPDAPMGWFWFKGHWGDKFYQLADERQWRFAGQYHYVNGPLGPRFKNLGRSRVCQSGSKCRMLDSIEEGKKSSWVGRRSLPDEPEDLDVEVDS